MRKEKNMALDSSVGNILNQQINKEFYSAYLYLTFADFYEEQGLKGFANWYVIQSQEELAHARILRRYLLDNDWTPTMEAIAKPDLTFTKVVEPIKAAYEHEQFITASINECYAVAQKANDFRTMQLLDWYVKEQGEEEATLPIFSRQSSSLVEIQRTCMTLTARTLLASLLLQLCQCKQRLVRSLQRLYAASSQLIR